MAYIAAADAPDWIKEETLVLAATYGPQFAVCDGIDDNLEIQAAMDAIGISGGVLGLSQGTFDIGAPILHKPNICIRGAGRRYTTLKAKNALNAPVIHDNSNTVSNIELADLTIDGNAANQTLFRHGVDYGLPVTGINKTGITIKGVSIVNVKGHGARIHAAYSVRITDSHFGNCLGTGGSGAGGSGIYMVNCTGAYVDSCSMFLNQWMGLSIATAELPGVSTKALVRDCTIYGQNGVEVDDGDNVTFDTLDIDCMNNPTEGNASKGMIFYGVNHTVRNCTFKRIDGPALMLIDARRLQVYNNRFDATIDRAFYRGLDTSTMYERDNFGDGYTMPASYFMRCNGVLAIPSGLSSMTFAHYCPTVSAVNLSGMDAETKDAWFTKNDLSVPKTITVHVPQPVTAQRLMGYQIIP